MHSSNKPLSGNRLMHGALWLAQGLVAVAFCWGGIMKLATPIGQLALTWPWAGDLPVGAVRLLGVIDLAGGIGVLLPALSRIKPGLTRVAAIGCAALQVCAMMFHASRGEFSVLPVNVVLLVLSALIAWGRWNR